MKGLGGMQRLKQVEVSERACISLLFFANFASCKPLQMDMPPKHFVHLLHTWKERTVMQAVIQCNSGIHS